MKNFTFTIDSRDRSEGDPTAYRIDQIRDVPGEYKVTFKVAPFRTYATYLLDEDPNKLLLLEIKGGGFTGDSSNPISSFRQVLSIVPGVQATEGVLYCSSGFRGPIYVQWTDGAHPDGTMDATHFPEHQIHMHFSAEHQLQT